MKLFLLIHSKVDSWQHEIERSITSNTDEISEEKNETLVMREEISQMTQENKEMSEFLVEEINLLKAIVNENKELIHDLKKENKNQQVLYTRMETTLKKEIGDLKKENHKNNELIQETKNFGTKTGEIETKVEGYVEELIASKDLVSGNKEFIEENKKMGEEISSLKNIVAESTKKYNEDISKIMKIVSENKDTIEENQKLEADHLSLMMKTVNKNVETIKANKKFEEDNFNKIDIKLAKEISTLTNSVSENKRSIEFNKKINEDQLKIINRILKVKIGHCENLDILKDGKSGIVYGDLASSNPGGRYYHERFCNQKVDGGGWTV